MDFNFNSEEQAIIDMVRKFCIQEIKPIAAEIDEQERFPREIFEKMGELGLMGMAMPEEYGGSGLSYVSYIAACEEIAKYCNTTTVMFSGNQSLVCWPINEFGTEEQKKKYLTPLCTGQALGAFGLTEPGAGSDAAGQKTTAEDKGDHWLINGTKTFITNGGEASIYLVMAMTDKSLGTKGISAFIVESSFPGFSIGVHEKKMGLRGSPTVELIFENCIVPKENLLGKVGQGFKIAMATLDGGRISVGAQSVGLAQGAIDACIEYVKQRVQFGKRISEFQNTQFRLADMQTSVDAARLLVYRSAQAKQDHDKTHGFMSAKAKLFASEVANDVARAALQLTGGYGYTREYPFERYMRDAKILEIFEGTNEIQRIVIANYMGLNDV